MQFSRLSLCLFVCFFFFEREREREKPHRAHRTRSSSALVYYRYRCSKKCLRCKISRFSPLLLVPFPCPPCSKVTLQEKSHRQARKYPSRKEHPRTRLTGPGKVMKWKKKKGLTQSARSDCCIYPSGFTLGMRRRERADQRDTTRIVSARQGLERSPARALIGRSRRKSGRPVPSEGGAQGRRAGQSDDGRGGVKTGARTEY